MPMIQDPHVETFAAVIAARINMDKKLTQDFIDTFNRPLKPVAYIRYKNPGPGMQFLEGQNSSLPCLFVWREEGEFYNFTAQDRVCDATCGIKYIMPSDEDIERVNRALVRVVERLDDAGQDTFEDQFGGALLRRAGIHKWMVRWRVRYGYKGPDGQGLYPTAEGTFMLTHEVNVFDKSVLPDVAGLLAQYDIRGPGQEGSDPRVINPILQQLIPEIRGKAAPPRRNKPTP